MRPALICLQVAGSVARHVTVFPVCHPRFLFRSASCEAPQVLNAISIYGVMLQYPRSFALGAVHFIHHVFEVPPLCLCEVEFPLDDSHLACLDCFHTLFFFKSINLPISCLFSIFGATFSIKHGAKIHKSVLTTKCFGNYFSIFCIMSAKNDVSSRFIAALEYLLGNNKVTDRKAFATKVGISPSMITEIYKGRSAVGTTAIQNIVKVFNISGDWLLTGEGDMLKTAPSDTLDTPQQPSPQAPSQEKDQKNKKAKATSSNTDTSVVELARIIAQQAEEIGRLKSELSRLAADKARSASDAPAPDIAHVG